MIVRQFLHWVRTAPSGERAEATNALARAYLHSDLNPDDRAAAEGAMILLLDDVSPLVRMALAQALASSPQAPAAVIQALAADQPEVAAVVLERSPLFIDAELVDQVATGAAAVQAAIARRSPVECAVAAAIAEVGSAEACLTLIENPDAEVAQFSIDRVVQRFGQLAAIREALFARPDLPASTRQALVSKLSATLADFVAAREWLEAERARRVAQEACEKATVALAAATPAEETRPLIRHLCASGQLTAGLILRALLSGNVDLFEQALAELSGVALGRVRGLVHDQRGAGFRAIFDRARLPASTWPAFRAAVDAMREASHYDEPGSASQLKRRMIERVLTGCEKTDVGELEPLLMLLRRFATEAAREEARRYCDGLVGDDALAFDPRDRVAA
ncbi:MAG TPA: DUF2336 domain-containing protein [Xanthobacteraceae bacterium]|nr:DUF2336 domain-containing protein [Xanthobacteraceae bacterium]